MRKRLHKILVTGGAGFIGSEFVRQAVRRGYRVVVVDNLTYAGDLARLAEVEGRYAFYKADICNDSKLRSIFKREKPDYVAHFAAETHVDRSIRDCAPFIKTNIEGTRILLDLSRHYRVKKFVHISTDEVYGEITRGRFSEGSAFHPNSPYAASKASADFLIQAYVRTHGFPAVIARPSNNYGPWQYPEKLIPVVILKALKDERVPVYSKGENVREWLYVSDCADAIFFILEKGSIGETYNVGSGQEKRNIDTVKKILRILGKPEHLISFVRDRPGHDLRYSLDCSKIRKLGWKPRIDFQKGMEETAEWYMQHMFWLESKLKYLRAYWKKVYQDK